MEVVARESVSEERCDTAAAGGGSVDATVTISDIDFGGSIPSATISGPPSLREGPEGGFFVVQIASSFALAFSPFLSFLLLGLSAVLDTSRHRSEFYSKFM